MCEEWLSDSRGNWTAYYHGQATRFLARYVKDSQLGAMPIRDITVAHLYDLIQSIAKRKTLSGDERKAGALLTSQYVCANTLTLYSDERLSADE